MVRARPDPIPDRPQTHKPNHYPDSSMTTQINLLLPPDKCTTSPLHFSTTTAWKCAATAGGVGLGVRAGRAGVKGLEG